MKTFKDFLGQDILNEVGAGSFAYNKPDGFSKDVDTIVDIIDSRKFVDVLSANNQDALIKSLKSNIDKLFKFKEKLPKK